MSLRRAAKAMIPGPVLRLIRRRRARTSVADYRNLSTGEVFAKVYREGVWGRSDDPDQPFYSGGGSHHAHLVSDYVAAVRGFLVTFERRPDVVDLGCGDFHVGAQVRELCGRYVACDVVPELIASVGRRYGDLDVDFRVLDLAADALPAGEVVFVRQVLQHLSNAQILAALPAICATYRYLVLTEHLPEDPGFRPNLDKLAGPHIRMVDDSGIVLTRPPFNLRPVSERQLCQVADGAGLLRTTLYRLRD